MTGVQTCALPISVYASSSQLVGNVYRVDRPRTLTKIEEFLTVSGTSVFTWVVYEGTSPTGTFTKVFERTSSASGASVYISSGALSVPLTVGKYYMLGVLVQGSFTRYLNQTGVQPFVSFGQAYYYSVQLSASSAPATFSTGFFTYALNNQRISTAQ